MKYLLETPTHAAAAPRVAAGMELADGDEYDEADPDEGDGPLALFTFSCLFTFCCLLTSADITLQR